MSIIGGADKRVYEEPEIRAMILRAVGRNFDFEIESIVPWVRRELLADSYGTKRVFIAGDAAHLMSPTGGFGMNTGIGDSIDLSWKLDGVLRGWGAPGLLRSYEQERRPVARRNIDESSENLKLMLVPRTTPPPPEIFQPGPESDAARKRYGEWYGEMMKREWYTLGVHLGYFYEGSPVIVPDGTPTPELERATYTQRARPGARAPHLWLKDGRSTLDLFGHGFVLLRIGADAPLGGALADAAAPVGLPLEIVTIEEPDAAALYEAALVLVRPDGHVAWRGDTIDARLAAHIVAVARGAGATAGDKPELAAERAA